MGRAIAYLYGLLCYVLFLGTFLYAIGFVGNFIVPKSIDSGLAGAFGSSLLINAVLLGIFAIQHSVMARPGFKAVWTRIVPKSVERSTYVLLASLALILLFSQWRPLPDILWQVDNELGRMLLWALFALGWLVVLTSTFLINHFDLFGLRQVHMNMQGVPYTELKFRIVYFYRFVRHPLYLGTLLIALGFLVMAWNGVAFGFAVAFVACHYGLRVLPNTDSLAVGVTRSVVWQALGGPTGTLVFFSECEDLAAFDRIQTQMAEDQVYWGKITEARTKGLFDLNSAQDVLMRQL